MDHTKTREYRESRFETVAHRLRATLRGEEWTKRDYDADLVLNELLVYYREAMDRVAAVEAELRGDIELSDKDCVGCSQLAELKEEHRHDIAHRQLTHDCEMAELQGTVNDNLKQIRELEDHVTTAAAQLLKRDDANVELASKLDRLRCVAIKLCNALIDECRKHSFHPSEENINQDWTVPVSLGVGEIRSLVDVLIEIGDGHLLEKVDDVVIMLTKE